MAKSSLPMLALSIFLLGLVQFSIAVRYGTSFTLFQLLQPADFKCLLAYGQVPVIRVHAGGKVDPNGLPNIDNARSVGFNGVEVYAQPDPLGQTTGSEQFEQSFQYVNAKYPLQRIWLLITDPRTWTANAGANLNFIRDFLRAAKNKNVEVGIYTSWYDWLLITNDYNGLQSDCLIKGCQLWYWHTLGQGAIAQTEKDFNDFRPFGSWQKPSIKEYDIVDNQVCGKYLNWSAFAISNNKKMRNGSSKANNRAMRKMVAAKASTRNEATKQETQEKFTIGDSF